MSADAEVPLRQRIQVRHVQGDEYAIRLPRRAVMSVPGVRSVVVRPRVEGV
ncbi:hypothetical protein SAMN04488564_10235 [Lentzea waywayandensis]|uniref:Uncharacterized protein n=1 Tax=Lentzea waywayandensis TaxID=84724 RepID=A0A1I6D9A1_9PSEU|nr:hypothetical protein [Lentzea waywayandensis]SFR02026.1 hypothetical protein SAMN04488564_10235 [Lentzea waywayandensis]